MIPDRYVWLAWACSFFVSWLLLFALCPRYRAVMWWSSLLAFPFGLTEAFFLGRYWNPPTLFGLARRDHFDVESFIFCFAIGGVASVLYNALSGQPLLPRPPVAQWRPWHVAAFAVPPLVFGAILGVCREPIWAGFAAFLSGTAARLAIRPDLAVKSCLGGLLFLIYYIAFLMYLTVLAPGYIQRTWVGSGPAGIRLLGLPLTEVTFALGFGLYWSGLYEQLDAAFALPFNSA